MSLTPETCAFVAAAYRVGLALEDFRAASDGPSAPPVPDDLLERIDDLVHMPGSSGLHEKLFPFRSTFPKTLLTTPSNSHRAAIGGISILQEHVATSIGQKVRDQLDAFLVLLLIEHERASREPRRARDYAPWLGVDPTDVDEMIQSRALNGLLLYVVPPEKLNDWTAVVVRLTVDGRLVAEGLLDGSMEMSSEPALRPGGERPVAARARIEGSIVRLEICNVFSFGEEAEPIEMGSLNLLIGANGAGKSNILEAIELLSHTPRDIQAAIREAGGIHDVLSQRTRQEGLVGSVEAVIRFAHRKEPLRHRLCFAAEDQRFGIVDERIENADAQHRAPPFFFFGQDKRGPIISAWYESDQQRRLEPVRMPATRSILSERRDPTRYPELADLAGFYEGLRSYREPLLGRLAAPRAPQATDLPNDRLLADGGNLALLLARIRLDPPRMRAIVDKLKDVYASVNDIETKTEGGTIQVFLQDDGFPLPARRISDGTMRFLCLLVVLTDPEPPPIVLIEEPELGLHPDAIVALADLLRDAAERTQLIVTTHSEALVDKFGDTPEAVLVVDKAEPSEGGSTYVRRLDREDLKEWLEAFSLGRLWRMGEIGGNRW